MKDNFIHVCFIIDRSGSMSGSEGDVIGGYKSVIDEQKKNTDGTCAVSLYTFDNNVTKHYVGKDINEVSNYLEYSVGGLTAMNDAIGTAINDIGKWCADMPENERPCKNMIVIMTDGCENASCEYSLTQVKNMIKEQTEKYSWEFVYLGTDITNTKDADTLGINLKAFTTKADYKNNYKFINSVTNSYRAKSVSLAAADAISFANDMTKEYNIKTGNNIKLNETI